MKKKNEWRIVKFIEKKGTNQKKYIVKMAIIGTKEIIVIFFYKFFVWTTVRKNANKSCWRNVLCFEKDNFPLEFPQQFILFPVDGISG